LRKLQAIKSHDGTAGGDEEGGEVKGEVVTAGEGEAHTAVV
jgi:hypothetical protein